MRLSWPMPRRTSLMSASMRSHRLAISLMKLILVDKQGVGHVLGHLRAFGRHHQKRLLGAQERRSTARAAPRHFVPPHAHDHAVGLHEVVDRRPFLEELGVAGHVAIAAGEFLQPGVIRALVPTGTVLLVTTMRIARRGAAQFDRPRPTGWTRSAEPSAAGGVPTASSTIRLTRTVPARSVVNCRRPTARFRPASFRKPRFVNRQFTAIEPVDFRLIDIDANDVVAAIRQTGAGDETDIARSHDRNFHDAFLSSIFNLRTGEFRRRFRFPRAERGRSQPASRRRRDS